MSLHFDRNQDQIVCHDVRIPACFGQKIRTSKSVHWVNHIQNQKKVVRMFTEVDLFELTANYL